MRREETRGDRLFNKLETMKCFLCEKEVGRRRTCDRCLEERDEFEEKLKGSRKAFAFTVMRNDDQARIMKKCKGRSRKFCLKFVRNAFNRMHYMSSVKNSQGRYWSMRI